MFAWCFSHERLWWILHRWHTLLITSYQRNCFQYGSSPSYPFDHLERECAPGFSTVQLLLSALPVLYSLEVVKSIQLSRLLLHFWWLKEYIEISFLFALKTILIIPFLIYFLYSVHRAEHDISVISLSTADLWNSSISFDRCGNWNQRLKKLDKIMQSKSRNPSLVDATVLVFNH